MSINVNEIFKKNIKFVEYLRSGIIYYTENLDDIEILKKLGWKYNKTSEGFRTIPPEVTICDITDIKKANQNKNFIFNFALYSWLRNNLKNNLLDNIIRMIILNRNIFYRNFMYHISEGPTLEYEIRIAGIDKRIKNLKNDLIEFFLNSKEYTYYYNNAINFLNVNAVEIKKHIYTKESLSEKEKIFFNDLENKMNLINKKYKYDVFEDYIIDKTEIEFSKYDIILFLPNGCFKYLHQYISESNVDKIMFWEYHMDKEKNSTYKLYNKKFKNKRVLVIDSIYSGKTLKKIKNLIENDGGTVELLGISPKSKKSIKFLDYVLILDKIYKVRNLNLLNDSFFEEKYKEFVRRNSSNERRNTSENKNK